jgi:hypothetical protein
MAESPRSVLSTRVRHQFVAYLESEDGGGEALEPDLVPEFIRCTERSNACLCAIRVGR